MTDLIAQKGLTVAAGFPEDPDMNNPDSTGTGPVPMNNPGGIRMSAALSYLNPNRHRLNLTIQANALAECLLLEGKRCTGVRYSVKGQTHTALARREVIVSAGTVNSPQLLELSGIGQADRLGDLGIAVRHDLAGVGENLRDHYAPRFSAPESGAWRRSKRTNGTRVSSARYRFSAWATCPRTICRRRGAYSPHAL